MALEIADERRASIDIVAVDNTKAEVLAVAFHGISFNGYGLLGNIVAFRLYRGSIWYFSAKVLCVRYSLVVKTGLNGRDSLRQC